MYKCTLYFEIARLGLVPYKERFGSKITIVSTVQFNSFNNFERSNNGSFNNHPFIAFFLATDTFVLDKIHPLAHPLAVSNVIQDLFI